MYVTLHTIAGSPPMPGEMTGTCRVCGQPGTGELFHRWVRDTFTDHDKLRPGDIICHACQFLFLEQSELLAAKVGKDKPQRMRNYSHFIVNDEWHALNKGQKREMRDLLVQSPSLVVIAESGQRHLLFRAQPGWWVFEDAILRPDRVRWQKMQQVIDDIYPFVTKEEIRTGHYNPSRLRDIDIDWFMTVESQLERWRGNVLFSLALFLAVKEDTYVQGHGAERGDEDDCGESVMAALEGDTGRPQNALRGGHLAAVHEPTEKHSDARQLSLDIF